jgi:hypothetical protein
MICDSFNLKFYHKPLILSGPIYGEQVNSFDFLELGEEHTKRELERAVGRTVVVK